eukprot:322159-Chlamydomonas_euryale.AAC.1
MSTHPASAAPRFRLLGLALRHCQHALSQLGEGGGCPVPLAMLHDRVLRAAAAWFAAPPAFNASMTEAQAQEQ